MLLAPPTWFGSSRPSVGHLTMLSSLLMWLLRRRGSDSLLLQCRYVQIAIASTDFIQTFSARAKGAQHASKHEYGVLCLSVQAIVRQAKWHHHRTVALVDSLALMHAVRKGRSSGTVQTFGSVLVLWPRTYLPQSSSCTSDTSRRP